jgi:hypothetical protein
MPIVCFQYMYGLKPVPFREQRRTSGAKALIIPAIYGTAEAVPFVQSCFAVGREHSGVERSAVSFRFSQTLCYKTPSLQTCMPQRVQMVCENRKRNSSGENSSSSIQRHDCCFSNSSKSSFMRSSNLFHLRVFIFRRTCGRRGTSGGRREAPPQKQTSGFCPSRLLPRTPRTYRRPAGLPE